MGLKNFTYADGALSVLMAFVLLCVFWPVLGYDFVNLDDYSLLVINPMMRTEGASGLWSILTEWQMGNYIPLTYLLFRGLNSLFGLDPTIFHGASLSVHMGNAILVYFLFLRLLIFARVHLPDNRLLSIRTACWIAALLFAIHPLRVETVAWVSQLKDVLCLFFYLGSIHFYLSYLENLKPSSHRTFLLSPYFWAAYVCGLFACLAKGMAVSLPLTLMLLDFFWQRRLSIMVLREKVPFFLIASFTAFMNMLATQGGRFNEMAFPEIRIINAFASMGFYVEKTFLPFSLSPLYYYEANQESYFWLVYISALATALLLGALWLFGGRNLRLGLIFYVFALLPVLGLNQVGLQEAADRFSYLPTLVSFLGLAVIINHFLSADSRRKRLICWLSISFLFAYFSTITARQLPVWKNSLTLWSHVAEVRPHPHAYANKILILANVEKKSEVFQECLLAYERFPRETVFLEYALILAFDAGDRHLTEILSGQLRLIQPSSPTLLWTEWKLSVSPEMCVVAQKRLKHIAPHLLFQAPEPLAQLQRRL